MNRSDKATATQTDETDETENEDEPEGAETETEGLDETSLAVLDDKALAAKLGEGKDGGYEVIQTGGLTKWIDLTKFQVDPNASEKKPVKGNGRYIEAILLDRQEIPVGDKEAGELNADGVKVRFFYNVRLLTPCPVSYKDENKTKVEEIAPAGEVIAIGERHKLAMLRQWVGDGGVYQILIQPHSRIKVGGGRTMWTFFVGRKVLRQPAFVRAEVVQKPPF